MNVQKNPNSKMISPKVDQMSQSYPNAVFIKVDVDDLAEVAQQCNIRAMPTFQFFLDGVKVGEVVGANAAALETEVKKHYK